MADRPATAGPLGPNEMPDRWGFVISVDTQRIRRLGARLEALGAVYGDAYDQEMDEVTQTGVLDIQRKWPVDTGRSRGLGAWRGYGWNSVRRGKFKYTVVNPQPYTVFVLKKGSKRPKEYQSQNPDLQVNAIVKPVVLEMRRTLLLTGRGLVARLVRNRGPGSGPGDGGGATPPASLPSVPGSPQRGRGAAVRMVEQARRRAEFAADRADAAARARAGIRARSNAAIESRSNFIYF